MKYLNRTCLSLIFATIVQGLWAQQHDYVIDDGFSTGTFYTHGAISDLLIHSDNRILVSGGFSILTEAASQSLLNPSGDVIYNMGSASIIGFPKNFHYKQKYLRCGVSVLTLLKAPTGTDHSFKFEFQKSAYNGFLGNDVLDAIVEPDDRILAAGRFFTDSTDISPETIRQLCRIDSTGAPDPDFPMLHCATPVQAFVRDIKQLSDGSMILTGLFTEFGGHAYNQVGKLNPDFSVDTTFVNSFAPGGEVVICHVDSQDRIWVNAFSSNLIGEPPLFGYEMLRLMPDGTVDLDFIRPDLYFPPAAEVGMDGWINDIVEMPDGRFIVGGGFTTINGQAHQCIAMMEDDGTVVEDILVDLGPEEAEWGSISNPPVITRIRLLDDGKLLLGGSFSVFGGEPYHCLVRLMPQPVSTTDRENRGTLKLYPNPASNHFRIAQPEGLEPLRQVELWDMQGRLLRTWPASQSPYPTDGLPAGMYVVRAAGNEGVYTQKLIVPD